MLLTVGPTDGRTDGRTLPPGESLHRELKVIELMNKYGMYIRFEYDSW